MENYSDFMFACESYMDDLQEELAMESAMESATGDKAKATMSDIADKLRSGFAKLKRAVKKGDKDEAAKAKAEIAEGADALDEAAAEDPEKRGLSTAAKVGLAAAAVAATAAGMYGVGKSLDKKSKDNNLKVTGIGKVLKDMANGVDSTVGKVNAAAMNHRMDGVQKAYDKVNDAEAKGKSLEKVTKLRENAEKKAARLNGERTNHLAAAKAGVAKGIKNAQDKLFKKGNESFEAYDLYDVIMEAVEAEFMGMDSSVEAVDESLCEILGMYMD